MASHGVIRTHRSRTEEQRQQDLEKIKRYRDLEDQVRAHVANDNYTPEVFQLTTKLLRLNPEYYTIWNVRRRLLISGLLCKRSVGSSPSKESQSSSRTDTTTTSSAECSSSSLTAIQRNPESQTTGRNGTTADDTVTSQPAGAVESGAVKTKEEDRRNDLDVLKSELGFTVPLLMDFPKCYWIWKHRSWLLQQAIERLDPAIARRIWEKELELDTKMLTRDSRNFHAWGYRRNIVEHLESAVLSGKSMVESEFEFTTKRIHADLSNFSAWHNRSRLIPRLLGERGTGDVARKKFFNDELALIRRALNVGPGDQSLWYYHQFLMLDLIDHVGRPTITESLAAEERVSYITGEMVYIKDLLEDYDDYKLIFEALIDYTLAISTLEERQPSEAENADLKSWLSKLRELDPMRMGRWDDMERELALTK